MRITPHVRELGSEWSEAIFACRDAQCSIGGGIRQRLEKGKLTKMWMFCSKAANQVYIDPDQVG